MQTTAGANDLRREISARNRERAALLLHETTIGRVEHVIYAETVEGTHGNFLPASYRRILARPAWARRLEKTYTASARVPRAGDRRRGELECATSSDALLMNIFCYPGVLRRPGVCALLGVEPAAPLTGRGMQPFGRGEQPEFGVRAILPMQGSEVDRTEVDMRLGDLLVEAKLTEGGFGVASRERLLRYTGVQQLFAVDDLPTAARGVSGYQIVRGALAADQAGGRFLLLCDGRRADLIEMWFRVLSALRTADLRSRMQLCTWQELAAVLPQTVSRFLAEKYGVTPSSHP